MVDIKNVQLPTHCLVSYHLINPETTGFLINLRIWYWRSYVMKLWVQFNLNWDRCDNFDGELHYGLSPSKFQFIDHICLVRSWFLAILRFKWFNVEHICRYTIYMFACFSTIQRLTYHGYFHALQYRLTEADIIYTYIVCQVY